MGFYERSRYKDGLSGKKPGWIVIDEKGHRPQEAGYRDHLRNKDLAEQIRSANSAENDSSSYEGSPSEPLTPGQRILWLGIGLLLIYWAYSITIWFHGAVSAMHSQNTCLSETEFRPENSYLSRQPESLLNVPSNVIQGNCDWQSLILGFLVFPGGLLLWPGIVLIVLGLDEET
jgi:hypothetical protein